MHDRCSKPTCNSYEIYGGRGIRVCERWASFENFLLDMGERPSKDHSIDRIDGNGHYEPRNCRWATRKEQATHMVTSRLVMFRGERLTLAQLSDKSGIPSDTLARRLKRGWSVDRAGSEPLDEVKSRAKKGWRRKNSPAAAEASR